MRNQLGYHEGIPSFVIKALEDIAKYQMNAVKSKEVAEKTLERIYRSKEDKNSEELRILCA